MLNGSWYILGHTSKKLTKNRTKSSIKYKSLESLDSGNSIAEGAGKFENGTKMINLIVLKQQYL